MKQSYYEIEGGPSDSYGVDSWYTNVVNKDFDRHMAQMYWKHGLRNEAMAIVANNPNVGVQSLHYQRNGNVTTTFRWGAQAAGFLTGISSDIEALRLVEADSIRYGEVVGYELDPPQNPRQLTQNEINKIRSDITETLKNRGCAEFVAATLNQVASDTSRPLFSDDVLKNFNEVAKTGVLEATLLSGREAQAWGSAGGGDAKIQFNTQYPLTSPFPHVVGIRGIHETTHVSTNKRMYSYIAITILPEQATKRH